MRAEDDFERRPRKPGRFGFLKRRSRAEPATAVAVPRDVGKRMEDFARTRTGVEAYLEPSTLDQQPSVVLVAADGEWARFSPVDERSARKFAERHRMPAYDVNNVGYPRRMKEYRRRTDGPEVT